MKERRITWVEEVYGLGHTIDHHRNQVKAEGASVQDQDAFRNLLLSVSFLEESPDLRDTRDKVDA